MTNALLVLLFLILAVGGFFTFCLSLKEKDAEGKVISRIIIVSVAALIVELFAIFVDNPVFSSISFSVFFSMNTLILLYYYHLGHVYGNRKTPFLVDVVIKVIACLDIISMLSNVKFSHVAVFTKVTVGNVNGWSFEQQVPFYYHVIICYILLISFLIKTAICSAKAPKLYRVKYLFILVLAASGILSNLFFLRDFLIFDWVVLWYVIVSMGLYYFTYMYFPRALALKVGKTFMSEMSSAVMLFDLDGACIYRNHHAKKYIADIKTNYHYAKLAERIGFSLEKSGEKQEIELFEEDHIFLEVEYKQMADDMNRFEGCYVIIDDVTQAHKELSRKLYLVSHDPLTGVYNTAAFYDAAEQLIKQRSKVEYSIITTNIKQFKLINDVLGRDIGDQLLMIVADELRELKYEDICYGRVESDKFVIAAPSSYDVETTLNNAISRKFEEIRQKNNLSLSIVNYYGVYPVTEPNLVIADMCDRANMALLTIKGDVGHNIAYYNESMKEDMIWESRLLSELPTALEKEEFVIYYQPQIDSATEKIVGAEALVRWEHPKQGLLAPSTFIPLLERRGFIFKLDKYVWTHAAKQLKELRDEGYDLAISVNISPRDIYAGDVRQIFNDIIKEYDLPPEKLRLEITETAASLDMGRFVGIVTDLQRSGFTMEMDDFGSGYSSLNSLKNIPIDVLKMDMLFLDDAGDEEKGKKIMRSIVELAKALELPLIAEGVERKSQVEFLASIGCRNLQGYYYSKPVPFEKFKVLLDSYEIGPLA